MARSWSASRTFAAAGAIKGLAAADDLLDVDGPFGLMERRIAVLENGGRCAGHFDVAKEARSPGRIVDACPHSRIVIASAAEASLDTVKGGPRRGNGSRTTRGSVQRPRP